VCGRAGHSGWIRRERRVAAEHGLDPREKLVPAEGLGHVVIGAELEPGRLVDLGVLGGQHDHRHIRPLGQDPAYFGASWPREHEAEQHQVTLVAVERRRAPGRSGRQTATSKPSLRSM
jgi:hypothetical protein